MFQYEENNSLSQHEENLSNNIDLTEEFEMSNQREHMSINKAESIVMDDSYDGENRIFEDFLNLTHRSFDSNSGIYDHNETQRMEFEPDSNSIMNQCIH